MKFLVAWVVLLAVHFDCLLDPVYWDTILGSFHQAIWLKNHQFNQFELCRSLPSYSMGGPKVYTNSIYPLLQAVLMKGLPDIPTLLLLNHVLAAGFSAGFLVAFNRLARTFLALAPAMLLTGILMTYPMFHSLTATINMDMPTSCLTLWGILFFVRERYLPATAFLTCGILIKQSTALAIIAICMIAILQASSQVEWKRAFVLLIPLPFCFSNYFVSWFLEPPGLSITEQSIGVSDWLFRLPELFARVRVLFYIVPDQTILLMATFIGSTAYIGWSGIQACRLAMVSPVGKRVSIIRQFFQNRILVLLCSLSIFGFVLLYYAMVNALPRYVIWVLPLQLLFIAYHLKRYTACIMLGSVVVIGLNIVNHNGALYRLFDKAPLHGFGMDRERSMEYRTDLKCNQKLAEAAQLHLKDYDILTCWPLTHLLAAPEFGYVKSPLSVVSVYKGGLPALKVPHVSTWRENRGPNLRPIVFITTVGNFFGPLRFDPNVHQLASRIEYGDRSILIYQEK